MRNAARDAEDWFHVPGTVREAFIRYGPLGHDGQLLRASEGLAPAFFHALSLLGLVSAAALLLISLASNG